MRGELAFTASSTVEALFYPGFPVCSTLARVVCAPCCPGGCTAQHRCRAVQAKALSLVEGGSMPAGQPALGNTRLAHGGAWCQAGVGTDRSSPALDTTGHTLSAVIEEVSSAQVGISLACPPHPWSSSTWTKRHGARFWCSLCSPGGAVWLDMARLQGAIDVLVPVCARARACTVGQASSFGGACMCASAVRRQVVLTDQSMGHPPQHEEIHAVHVSACVRVVSPLPLSLACWRR